MLYFIIIMSYLVLDSEGKLICMERTTAYTQVYYDEYYSIIEKHP